ncbi:Gfo/Idh/MocA family oxidoreductase [Bdellovibrio sp. HCB-110]|uniref:Gfo/Idh/MocA family oxidoreductase n=1 Tax=Bdellovibrio sp. HCB-110 TaxID=3391182 RepID=UPI0039B5038C
MDFAVIGVGGYIAPRHLEAIKDLGHNLVAAYDRNDSVGILDRYFPDCQFFTDFEKFAEFVEARQKTSKAIDYISICSPNYMHKTHIKFALSRGCHVICEKPLVLTESELDDLKKAEVECSKKVHTILQLRLHPEILKLQKKILAIGNRRFKVDLDYITSRGHWYFQSWKADVNKSGGLSTNIGVHFFDMLTWIFGECTKLVVDERTMTLEKGSLELEKADVSWILSVDRNKLPLEASSKGKSTFRSLRIDGEEFEFSEGFTDLHKKVYSEILNSGGFGIEDSRPGIRLVEMIRSYK